MFRERLLSCHPTKTCYVLFDSEKWKRNVREELERSPLMFGDFIMKEKQHDVYLGDTLSGKCLAASVEDTITQRLECWILELTWVSDTAVSSVDTVRPDGRMV